MYDRAKPEKSLICKHLRRATDRNLLMQLLGSKAFTGENNLFPIFLKVLIEMEPDLAHS